MIEEDGLDKMNRINLLFDFYSSLLTEKQRVCLEYYFHENYSFGEISEVLTISRQAVSEHIKRAEQTLHKYEKKLQLLEKHERRLGYIQQLELGLKRLPIEETTELKTAFQQLRLIDGL